MIKTNKKVIAFNILLFYVLPITCLPQDGSDTDNATNFTLLSMNSTVNLNSMDDGKIEEEDFQTIKFGKNVVKVYDTNEIKNDDGSVETRLSLNNGIFFNLNAIPKKENDLDYFIVIGTFEFRTPDEFSYAIQFQVDPKNFTLLNFERKETVPILEANPKILAALAGR
ncbi:uncharacterized protein LOC129608150 [Condylostylus longicornis]|uniref:uncharacterized protein LOC129608150 n=1 Tax=Condylostylus longicornis TaxID=2530218 RepID=UPI00244E4C69|nr:uncharacterized protein LOC129608150 [Condylostylus longicornis]